ncbi:hypothetical protein FHX08_003864 [Rhizobium sp. BK529]|nr:hypothetical protein [Rhizobium sp. BK529]
MDLIDACRRGPVADANGQFGQTVVNWWRMHL